MDGRIQRGDGHPRGLGRPSPITLEEMRIAIQAPTTLLEGDGGLAASTRRGRIGGWPPLGRVKILPLPPPIFRKNLISLGLNGFPKGSNGFPMNFSGFPKDVNGVAKDFNGFLLDFKGFTQDFD